MTVINIYRNFSQIDVFFLLCVEQLWRILCFFSYYDFVNKRPQCADWSNPWRNIETHIQTCCIHRSAITLWPPATFSSLVRHSPPWAAVWSWSDAVSPPAHILTLHPFFLLPTTSRTKSSLLFCWHKNLQYSLHLPAVETLWLICVYLLYNLKQ